MKRLIQISLLAAFVFMGAKDAKASHLLGGEITWECIQTGTNKGKFIFTLVLYKECANGTAGLGGTESIVGPNGNIPCTRISQTDISPSCSGGSGIFCGMTTGIPTGSPSGNGAVERHFYRSAPVNLFGTPPPGGWEFYWTSCCRPGGVVNTFTGGYYLRAKMYPYTPVGGTVKNVNQCYDSSPYFSETGAITICEGPFTYNHLASDKDLDSLYVRFADPLASAGSPVAWNAGYSSASPYPSTLTNAANGPVTLNGQTGEVGMNIQNGVKGTYASCYAIEAWKCGQGPNGPQPILVAEVFRDVGIVFQANCYNPTATPPAPYNNEPVVNIDTTVYTNIRKLGAKNYSTTVYPGDTIDFRLIATDNDFNFPNNRFQYIYFDAKGLQAASPLTGTTGCDGPTPCASFTPINSTPPVSLKNEQAFFWVPDCQHLNVDGNFCSPFNTFTFSLRMQDDGCPAPRVALTTFVVKVLAGDPTPPYLNCLIYTRPNGDIRLEWNRAPQDSGLAFNYYMLLGAQTKTGTYDTLQYITDIDSLSTVVNAGLGYEHFYMIKSTGKCDFLSGPSDTLSLMKLSLTATPPGSAEVANLSWNALRSPLPYTTTGLYEIWTEAPAGSNNWSQVGSTTGLTYKDTVTVCNAVVNYQIRVTDTTRNCQSMSTLDSARFSDKTNNDAIVLDSVSVNAAGNAIISWKPTKYADVVNYYLYFNDPKLGWIVVDTVPAGTPMPHEWPGSKADTRSEQFKVTSVDSCGNQSDDKIVKPHATIFLRNYLNKCEAYSRISWNTYEGFGKDAISGYKLLVQTNGGPWSQLYVAGPQDTSYLQRNLVNGTVYCYRVQAVDTTGRTSTSNELCINAEVPRKSQILYLAQVTNDADRGSIKLNTFIDAQADVLEFIIERAPDELGPYRTIATVAKPGGGATTVTFSDYGAMPDSRHYYYRLSATDSCGGRDTVSNLARNILLQVTPRPNLTNLVTWNPYTTWAGKVARYDIYRKGAEEVTFKLAGTTAGNDTTFVDDISDYRETPGNFCYYVLAVEGTDGTPPFFTQDNGQPFFSRSNERCINQKARIYIPTAFRPGSDILENRFFGPSMKFNEVSEYHFYVMNRWGVKVFETFDPTQKWDGTYNGADAQQGVYIYFLKYSTPGGIPQEERGDFTLIR